MPLNTSSISPPVYLFVLPWSPAHVGGVNQVVLNLAREMTARGSFQPVILVTDWEARAPVRETVHGIRVVRWQVRGPVSGFAPKQRLALWWWLRRFEPAFEAFCREQRVAVINPHFPTEAALTLASMALRLRLALKILISFHGTDVSGLQAASAVQRQSWKAVLSQCQGVIACSSALSQRLQRAIGVTPGVIHNGIDADSFIRKAGPVQRGERRLILSVGKFEGQKGQDVLLQAFAGLAELYADIDLMLVGATDHALPVLKQSCEQLGIHQRVRFMTDLPHDEAARCFASATMFVLPSRQEAFGLVLLEAGCLALPVVATAVGGVPEVVEDGVTARLVKPDSPDELVHAIRQVLDDSASAQAMGERLRTRVLGHFSWARAHDAYVRLAGGAGPVPPS